MQPASTSPESAAPQRYLALDAYRGFIMLILASGGFGLAGLAKRDPAFTAIANQFEHMSWEWISFWDLIQPAFMFMVGVAMPFAIAARLAQGFSQRRLSWHILARAFRLILMSQILMSISRGRAHFQLINVLAQIGITYFLCYLIAKLRFRWQAVVAGLIRARHWALFVAFPGAGGPFMDKAGNIGSLIEKYVFGRVNPDHWATINFITSTVTTLFGVWTGQLLRSAQSHAQKMRVMAISAAASLALGLAIASAPPRSRSTAPAGCC